MTKRKTSILEALLRIFLQNRRSGKDNQKNRETTTTGDERESSKSDRRIPSDRKTKPEFSHHANQTVDMILNEAGQHLGVGYKYAGTSPNEGFDCSGLVYYVFGKAGIGLRRASYLQAQEGQAVDIAEVTPGDLIFFAHQGDRINHVGIVTSHPGEPLSMIHSSSSKGVIRTNVDYSAYWKDRLKCARRII